MLNLFYYDSMGMLSRQRMIENDSDGVLIRNLVNKLILIKKKSNDLKIFNSVYIFSPYSSFYVGWSPIKKGEVL